MHCPLSNTFDNARCLCTIAERKGKIAEQEEKHLPQKTFRNLGLWLFFFSQSKDWLSLEMSVVSIIFVFLHLLVLNWCGKFPCLLTSGVLRALPPHFLLCMLSDLGEKLDLGWGISNSVQLCPQWTHTKCYRSSCSPGLGGDLRNKAEEILEVYPGGQVVWGGLQSGELR